MRIVTSLVALVLPLSFVGDLAAQDLQTEGVVYSFMQVRIGTAQQFALIPRPADTVRPDAPLTASLPNAFQVLRGNKVATYGGTAIQLTDADLRAGQVTVNVDPQSAPYIEVIAAETVYTFTQLGVDRVVFPGYHDGGLTRADIPYAVFVFEVPLWQTLGAGPLSGTTVRLPDGSTQDGRAVHAAIEANDPAMHRALLAYLAQDAATPRFAILGRLATLGIPGYEASVLPLLQHPDPYTRDAAIRALAPTRDTAALDAIVGVLGNDAEPGLRALAAQTLAASPVEAYHFYEIAFRVQNPDPATRGAALQELRASADPRASDLIASILLDADPSFALAAVDALAARQDTNALVQSLQNDAIPLPIRQAAASALATSGAGDARLAGLHFRGMNATGEVANEAARAIAETSGPNALALAESFLSHPDRTVRVVVARALGQRGDTASLQALGAAHGTVGDDIELRLAIEDAAVAVLRAGGPQVVDRSLGDSDTFLRAAAHRALGDLAAEGRAGGDAFARLQAGLADADPTIRAACARGLAGFGDERALTAILTVAQDADANVQGAVALALGSFPGESFSERVNPLVVEYVQTGEPVIMAGALEAIGLLGQTGLRGFVMERISFPEPAVRGAAMRATAALADPGNPRDAINAIAAALRDPLVENRLLAIRLLGGFENEASVLLISQVVNEPVPEIRFAAIDALARTGMRSAGSVLISMLEDPNREIKLACVAALRRIALRELLPDLQAAAAREADAAVAPALQEAVAHISANGR